MRASRLGVLVLRFLRTEEPCWGVVHRQTAIEYGQPYEGSIPEKRHISYPMVPLSRTTSDLVQELMEAMVNHATK